jgi:hypothetical protein
LDLPAGNTAPVNPRDTATQVTPTLTQLASAEPFRPTEFYDMTVQPRRALGLPHEEVVAVAYYRTSSAANVGDKDSERRQREAHIAQLARSTAAKACSSAAKRSLRR